MTVDIPEIFQQLWLADKQGEAVLASLYVWMPNLFQKDSWSCRHATRLALSLMTCG